MNALVCGSIQRSASTGAALASRTIAQIFTTNRRVREVMLLDVVLKLRIVPEQRYA